MQPQPSHSSNLGLVTGDRVHDDPFSALMFRRLKILATWMFILTALFVLTLLVFSGMSFGYSRTGSKYQWVPMLSLGTGIIQVILSLLLATKLRRIEAHGLPHSRISRLSPMKVFMIVNLSLIVISLGHAISYGLLFIASNTTSVTTLYVQMSFIHSGHGLIGISAATLVAMCVLTVITGISSLTMGVVYFPLLPNNKSSEYYLGSVHQEYHHIHATESTPL